jgi:RNA polymerase sigma factor for flagellar operon FliA
LRRLDPLSRNQRDKANRVLRAQAELSGRLARAATTAEVAIASQLPVSEVAEILRTLSQESEFVDFDLSVLPDHEAASPAEVVEADDLRISLRSALQRLAGNQAAVLYRYYFEDATLDVIAAEMGISKERVRQIREAGEKKLRADFAVLAIWQSLLSFERD